MVLVSIDINGRMSNLQVKLSAPKQHLAYQGASNFPSEGFLICALGETKVALISTLTDFGQTKDFSSAVKRRK